MVWEGVRPQVLHTRLKTPGPPSGLLPPQNPRERVSLRPPLFKDWKLFILGIWVAPGALESLHPGGGLEVTRNETDKTIFTDLKSPYPGFFEQGYDTYFLIRYLRIIFVIPYKKQKGPLAEFEPVRSTWSGGLINETCRSTLAHRHWLKPKWLRNMRTVSLQPHMNFRRACQPRDIAAGTQRQTHWAGRVGKVVESFEIKDKPPPPKKKLRERRPT